MGSIKRVRSIYKSVVHVIHHDEETCPFQVQIGIYIDNRISTYLYLIFGRLKVKLSGSRHIGRGIIFSEVAYIGTQLHTQYFLCEFKVEVKIMVQRESGERKHCTVT